MAEAATELLGQLFGDVVIRDVGDEE